MKRLAILALAPLLLGAAEAPAVPIVNTAHLDWLKRPVKVAGGKTVTTWQIYASPVTKHDRQGPYRFVGDEDEGVGCVDDVARAAIVYAREFTRTHDPKAAASAKEALAFLAHMARPDGTYVNFIWADGSLNETGPTSKPGLNWWTARALWAIAEGAHAFRATEPAYAESLRAQAMRTVKALDADLKKRDGTWKRYGAFKAPGWFVSDAPDVTAVTVLGLAALIADKPDATAKRLIGRYGGAIARWRATEPAGALLPGLGPTSWHAYGAHMLHALAEGGRVTGDKRLLDAAKSEVDRFTTHLLIAGGPVAGFMPGLAVYPQIAYGLEPTVCGLLALSDATHDARYDRLAGLFGSWLFGDNPVKAPMYDPATGRVWDGIDRKGLSEDSGAESTIEGLLTLQALAGRPSVTPYLRATEVSRHGVRFFDAEASSRARVVAAPGLVGDRAAELAPGEAIAWDVRVAPAHYRLTPVVLRERFIPGEHASLVLSAGGRTSRARVSWPPQGAPWPAPEAVVVPGAVALSGPVRLTVAYADAARQKARLDGVIAQPDIEYRVFQVGDRRVAVARNLTDRPRTLDLPGFAAPLQLPPHGAIEAESAATSQETR